MCPVVEFAVLSELAVVGVRLLGGEMHEVAEGYIAVGGGHLRGDVRQGVEGVEGRWGDRVPVEHGEGVVVGWTQVTSVYYAGDISDDGMGWVWVM